MSALPIIGVMRDKFGKGCDSLATPGDTITLLPFLEAFTSHYPTDAHFVAYSVPGEDQLCRLNKPVLPQIRARGMDVTLNCLVMDFDNHQHAPWAPGAFDNWLGNLVTLGAVWPVAMQWTLCYATRGGARLVYVTDAPVPAEQAEAYHRGLVAAFVAHGVPLDESVSDWPRCFRLPFVTRDGVATFDAPFVEMYDNRLSLADVTPMAAVKAKEYAEIIPETDDQPSPDDVALLWRDQKDFIRQAKARLRGRESYPVCFEHTPIAEPGNRDNRIQSLVGQVIALTYTIPGCTPAHVYALLHPSVEQLEGDKDTPDWTRILWKATQRNWAKERADVTKKEETKMVATQAAMTVLEKIYEGMKEWDDSPILHSDDKAAAINYIERHMICASGKAYFLMGPDGYYDPAPVDQVHLIAAIRARGMSDIMETHAANAQGVTIDRTAVAVVNQYATVVQDIQATPGGRMGGKIEKPDTVNAILRLSSYSRNPDLDPCFNDQCDAWLKCFFGDNYELGLKWLAYALAFEEGPICALSLKGPPGVGKKMLAQALGECLIQPRLASGEDLVGDYNYGLLNSPFLVVDEGWPKAGKGRHPADQFRALVGGDPIKISRKYMAPVTVYNPVRILFTANNNDVVRVLSHGRELSPEDREALAIRLLHFNVDESAGEWLKGRGGLAMTGRKGARWIRSDGGEPSDFLLARHLLALYQSRYALGEVGKRFLVEGNASEELLFSLRTQAGSSPIVIESLLKMIECGRRFDGLAIVGTRVYALAAEVLDFYRANLQQNGRQLTTDHIANAFRGLAVQEPQLVTLPTREHMGPRRWCELDLNILADVARKDGWKHDRLQKILENKSQVLTGGPIIGRIGLVG